MSAGVNEVYAEEGEMWLRVSPGHAVSERWLQERAPDLYGKWWAAPGAAQRTSSRLRIEQRYEGLEATGTLRQAADRLEHQARPSERRLLRRADAEAMTTVFSDDEGFDVI